MGDPDFVDFDFTRAAIAMQLDNGRGKTVGRRGADSRTFEVTRIFRRPVTPGGAQRAVLSLRFGYSLGEGYGSIVEAGTADFAIGEFEIVGWDFQRLARCLEQQWLELTARLHRRVTGHHSDTAGITAEIHRCKIGIGCQHANVRRIYTELFC